VRFRIPDPPFHPRGGVAQHLYTAKYPSFGLRWSHRFGLTDSHGSHPLWALPRLNLPAVSGSLSHPLRDRHAPQCPCTALVPAMPRWRRPDASISAITSHRVLLALAHPSLWDHPLSMVLVYHRRARLSRVFWKLFSGVLPSQGVYFATWRPLARLRWASLGGAGVRIPS